MVPFFVSVICGVQHYCLSVVDTGGRIEALY